MLDGRIMGLDIGDKTIGVAVSDIMGITAQGVKTIRRETKKKDIEELKNIIKERQVNKIVSGLPKNMNGTLGPQGEKVLKFCDLIKEETGLDIIIIKPAYTFSKIRKHYQTVGIGYLCIPKNDHVQLSDEHTDYLFATIDKAKELLNEEIFNDIIYTINEYYDKMAKK